ncbi:hypothetical protein [Allosalinactinospora lopnorensis]|uniref:hypothetical protein n=1 Tax=Allosalinactinospora lopnorensis TaxID=1352348 RepID=UPI0012E24AED|nr:hypothetical protein [Allosalinactinospora lopnorensis]
MAFYAVMVGCVSGLEVVLFRHAHRVGLLRRSMPDRVYRWSVLMSLMPVGFFAASVPVAFFSVNLAVAVWFLFVPVEALLSRRKPAGADDYF